MLIRFLLQQNIMAIFSNGGFSSPDVYLFFFLLLLPCLSVPFNCFVIKDNIRKKASIARSMYLTLSVVDLVACPYIASHCRSLLDFGDPRSALLTARNLTITPLLKQTVFSVPPTQLCTFLATIGP